MACQAVVLERLKRSAISHQPAFADSGVAAFAFRYAPSEGWARQDSNLGPRDYESPALTAELQAHVIFNYNIANRMEPTPKAFGGKLRVRQYLTVANDLQGKASPSFPYKSRMVRGRHMTGRVPRGDEVRSSLARIGAPRSQLEISSTGLAISSINSN